jgi:predicted O-methyltransferase YrrM
MDRHFTFLRFVIFAAAGAIAVLALDARRRRIGLSNLSRLSWLAILDLLPPALTSGFVLVLVVSLYPQAAAEGVLQLRSPSVLAIAVCLIALPALWSEGHRQIQFQRPIGLLFAEWLIFVGALSVLLGAAFHPTGENVTIGLILITTPLLIAGGALIFAIVPSFVKKYEGLRILDRVAGDAQFTQPEYAPSTPECPQPELWRMLDSQTTEVEVLDFLKTLVTTIKPKLVVETGTFLGHGTLKLAEGVRENGFGKVITIEFDPAIRARAEERFAASGLSPWIESRLESSLETNIEGMIDLLYSDSHLANREAEIRRLLPQLDPRGLLMIHDASSHFKIVREAALRLEEEGLISAVLLSTPRGIVVAQRRAGRK